MKKINENELDFVVKHYKEDRINTEAAWKKFKKRNVIMKSRKSWKSISVAASVLIITSAAIACIVLGYRPFKSAPKATHSATIQTDTAPAKVVDKKIKVFKFDKEPIGKVLKKLSAYYGKSLSTTDSTKVLSGEIEATSCEDMVSIIESTLDIKITME